MPRAPSTRKKPRAPAKIKKTPLTPAEEKAKKKAEKDALRLLAKVPLMEMKPLDLKTPEEIEYAADKMKEIGVGIGNVHDSESDRLAFQKEVITQVWNSILSDQALTPEKAAQVRYITDELSLKWYSGDLPKWLEKELYNAFKKMTFLHCGFGAPSSNKSFNLNCSWKLRCSKRLSKFAQCYLRTKDIKFSIDRCIAKFPGQGDQEFLHKDQDINTPVRTGTQLHGKYCATESTFLFVPRSHKDHEEMFRVYKPLYPDTSGDKWGLDATKEDPLNFFQRARKVIVPAGTIIFWDTSTIHGVLKNTSKHICFGLYIGYETNVERPRYMKKAKKEEYQDRFDVWSKGVSPQLHPSCDRVHGYPFRFQNYHRILGQYLERMDTTSEQFDFSKRRLLGKGPERWVPHLVEHPPKNYEPPQLTRRGQEMLVGKNRVEQFFPSPTADVEVVQVD